MTTTNYGAKSHDNPPLVPAVEAIADDSFLIVDGVEVANESQPLLVDGSRGAPILSSSAEQGVPPSEDNDLVLIETDEEKKQKARMMGAGIATGILGSIFCGPLFGILLGFGAAYATKSEGAVGDSARAVGDVALSAKERAVEIDQKHNVVGKCKEVSGQAWEKAKEMDQKHNILSKTKDFFVFCAGSIQDFCQQNRVVERTVDAANRSASWAADQISNAVEKNSNNNSSSSTSSASNAAGL
ncbi:hypothetical protein ACA910_021059 [Epithemia clementina (nom. ined.)]